MAAAGDGATLTGMRILLLALHFAEYAASLARALAETGHEVSLAIYRSNAIAELGPAYPDDLSAARVQVLSLDRPKTLPAALRNAQRIVRFYRQFRPDVVHAQETGRDEVAAALPFLLRRPFVLTVHDPAPHSGLDARRLRFARGRVYQSLQRRACAAAITHGETLRRSLVELTGMPEAKVFVIPHGPLGGSANLGQGEPGSGSCRLLFFGRVHAYKGLDAFIDAVKALRLKGCDVRGVVAGRGSDLDRHRTALSDQTAFELRDYYIPPTEVASLFSEAYAVVLPYRDGTQSGVAAMALGYGVPVVATAVGSIPEFVRDGVNGLLVQPGDHVALCDALARLVSDRPLRTRLHRGALELRDGCFSWASIAEKTLHVYQHTVQSG